MKLIHACVLLLIVLPGLPYAQKPLPLADDAPGWARELDAMLGRWAHKDCPGGIVIVTKGRKIEMMRAYGMANLEHETPITPDTVFDIASLSKQFTGYLIARAEVRKQINRNDLIRDHLPWLPECMRDVRIRHLIHHESGIRDWPGALALSGMRMHADTISFDRIRHFIANQRALNFAPGTDHLYSNTNYNLLALLLEKIEEKSFSSIVKRRIFRPLVMESSVVRYDPGHLLPRAARSYMAGPHSDSPLARFVPRSISAVHNGLEAPGSSSIQASGRDFAQWMTRIQVPNPKSRAIFSKMSERSGRDHGYAYGQVHGEIGGQKVLEHTGEWAEFRSAFVREPETGYAVAVLSNGGIFPTEHLARRLLHKLLDPSVPLDYGGGAGGRFGGRRPSWPDLDGLAGLYLSDELGTVVKIRTQDERPRLVLERHDGETLSFRPKGSSFRGGDWWGRKLDFERSPTGEITGLRLDQERNRGFEFRRIGPLPAGSPVGKSPR